MQIKPNAIEQSICNKQVLWIPPCKNVHLNVKERLMSSDFYYRNAS